MSKGLPRIDPFKDENISDRLAAWAEHLEDVVANLNQTLAEVKQYAQKGPGDVRDDGAADTTDGG